MFDTSGLFLSAADLAACPATLRDQILVHFLAEKAGTEAMPRVEDVENSPTSDEPVDENHVEFSVVLARRFLERCQPKTKSVITEMVRNASRKFKLSEVASAVGTAADALSGVWAGLTRRTHTIAEDQDAYLIFWHNDAAYDKNGKYIDQTGELSEMSYRSFRRALGVA